MTNHKNTRGFNLLELMLVVAIGALIVFGGMYAYNLTQTTQRTTEMSNLVQTIINGTRKMYLGQANYGTGIITQRLSNAGIISGRFPLVATNNDVRGPFGNVRVTAATNTFNITANTLPSSACITLARDFNPDSVTNLASLNINGTIRTTYTPTDLAGFCNLPTNVIIWRVR